MEGKDKKKESIDEILSDLNGLLNKMPSILDGIKMPELQPLEPPKAASPQPEPAPAEPVTPEPVTPEPAPRAEENLPPQDFGDKTVVLQPFSGLPEGAQAPELPEAQPAAEPAPSQDADKTVVLQPFAGLSLGEQSPQEPAPATEPEPPAAAQEKLTPQSLGDFMFGQEEQTVQAQPAPATLSGSPLEPPEEKPARPAPAGPSLSISEFTPPAQEASAAQPAAQEAPAFQPEAAPEALPQAQPEPAAEEPAFAAQSPADIFPAAEAAPEKRDALPAYANTSDFGIPDIDALIQLSENAPLPEAGVIPEAVQAIEENTDGPSIQGLSEEPQPAAQGDTVEANEPKKDENTEAQQPAPAASAFDAFAIDSAGDAPAQADAGLLQPEPQAAMPADQGGETLRLDTPAAMPDDQGGETLRLDPPTDTPVLQAAEELPAQEPGAAPAPQAEGGIEFGSFAGLGEAAAPAAEAAPEAAPGVNFSAEQPKPEAADQTIPDGAGLELSVGQPQPEAADQTMPGGAGLELSVGRPQTDMPGGGGLELGGGDATLVVAPRPDSSGDEEKTVIFQAGAPSTTSRAQAGDLTDLAAKKAPEGIPAERLRTLMFLYAAEDKALCATVLAELDSICLKSAVKPMFIKRSAVNECDPEANPNFVQQSVTDSGAQGLICLGNIPPDKVSEIEGAFAASGGFFRYYDSSSFSHSAALDLVTDLIVR